MINKFEAIGIGVSIIAMAVALFLLRVDSGSDLTKTKPIEQSASVVVSDSGTQREVLGNALGEAIGPSGEIERLIVDDIVIGSGEEVKQGDKISVHYIGTLQNGQQFDNSYTRGTPFTFTIGEGKVITGWEQSVIGMKTGGQRILSPPDPE